eukprot:m.25856 g.25856  ORF g.25856 m.25856 type:complete len:319 (-) comp4215_c0_seq2:36-992(-)
MALASSVLRRSFAGARFASTGSKQVVGFIGLGNMGAHMARNLVKAGHPLIVNDTNKTVLEQFAALGCKVAKTPAEIAESANAIVTMLPASAHVTSVYTGKDGILSTVQKDTLLIDASTIDPATAKSVAAAAAEKGAVFADAPVSGGVGGAEKGTLTFMVGAEAAAFARIQALLANMGKNIVHCGPHGTGQVAKICNNMLLGISMIAVSETMALGVRNGMDPKLLASIINTSSGRCWSSDTYNPCPGAMEGVPASRGYTGGFGSALMLKDLGLAMNAAAGSKTNTPLGSLANQVYQLACSKGYADKDFSSMYKFLTEKE